MTDTPRAQPVTEEQVTQPDDDERQRECCAGNCECEEVATLSAALAACHEERDQLKAHLVQEGVVHCGWDYAGLLQHYRDEKTRAEAAEQQLAALTEERDRLVKENDKLREQRNSLHSQLSYRDLQASGGLPEAQAGDPALCQLCGHPMPAGEEMFNYHGYSGPCLGPPLQQAPTRTAEADLAALRSHVQQIAREWPPQHKRKCGVFCDECGGGKLSGRHRDGWIPGSGVFWHDFVGDGKCDCGLDAALSALSTIPRTDDANL